MKLIHLSDLHLGKRVNEFSMLEQQKYILEQIIIITEKENPDCVIIAGDIYDKSIPPVEAIQLFNDFLCRLADKSVQVFIISGNHDSPERIAFGSDFMKLGGVYVSPVYNGNIVPYTMTDSYGKVNIFMLPFIKPANVRRFFDEEIITYTDAVRAAVDSMNIDKSCRNILITHQFVTGAYRSESEDISVGGTDNVDASVFKDFDYVALGHIHRPQNIGNEHIRYCGTPLKYSFSEARHDKSVTVAELYEKGSIKIRTIPLIPQLDMREIKGTYSEVTSKSFYNDMNTQDYLHITLTDEEDVYDAMAKLRVIYPNLMKLDYDNRRTRSLSHVEKFSETENKTPIEHFCDFYEKQNNSKMSTEQFEFTKSLFEKIWEENT